MSTQTAELKQMVDHIYDSARDLKTVEQQLNYISKQVEEVIAPFLSGFKTEALQY